MSKRLEPKPKLKDVSGLLKHQKVRDAVIYTLIRILGMGRLYVAEMFDIHPNTVDLAVARHARAIQNLEV